MFLIYCKTTSNPLINTFVNKLMITITPYDKEFVSIFFYFSLTIRALLLLKRHNQTKNHPIRDLNFPVPFLSSIDELMQTRYHTFT